ncbi:phage tail assembly chaperone G [Citrobacter meridianamericanus]|uniref:phage tail assembly chaperone G n=1 Tax=Citrobacter meridianamericanus TaxID=2894201 RepID=UPI00351D6FCA
MFLKTDTFTYGDHSTVLSELSALQRVDYLMFIQSRTAEYDALPEALTEQERQAAFMQMGVDINAWLVSRALCESKKEDDARHLYDAVRAQWSFDALGLAADKVLTLSGMVVPVADDADTSGQEALTPEKP